MLLTFEFFSELLPSVFQTIEDGEINEFLFSTIHWHSHCSCGVIVTILKVEVTNYSSVEPTEKTMNQF